LPAARRAAELDRNGFYGSWILADVLLAQPDVDAAAALAAARTAGERADGAVLRLCVTIARALAANGDGSAAIAELERAVADPRFAADTDLPAARLVLDELRAARGSPR
jgi:hypothetical protein